MKIRSILWTVLLVSVSVPALAQELNKEKIKAFFSPDSTEEAII